MEARAIRWGRESGSLRCRDCVYWTGFGEGRRTLPDGRRLGMCRKHPPVIVPGGGAAPEGRVTGRFPEIPENSWCGEFEPWEGQEWTRARDGRQGG